MQYQPGDWPRLEKSMIEPNVRLNQPPELPLSVENIAFISNREVIFFKRVGATIVDIILLCLLFVGCISLGYYIPELSVVLVGSMMLGAVLYYLLIEGLTGYTAGKFVFRIQVVGADGRPPGILKELIRYLLLLVENGIIAAIAVLASGKKQRLGDRAANTFVLNTKELPPGSISRNKNIILTIAFSFMGFAAVISAIIGVATLIAGIADYDKEKVFLSNNKQFQVTAPGSWRVDKELNDEQDIGISNHFAEKYFMVLSEDKGDVSEFYATLEDYHAEIEELARENYAYVYVLKESRLISINGNEAYQFQLHMEVDDDYPFIMTITSIETESHFHQMYAWVLESKNNKSMQQELTDIINSFKEVARPASGKEWTI
ncbi:hypothetical protein PAECIP111893_04243 [Paenibacillus plantiphilus]|uniref:RDD domain-containing protein n=1 Tax=Paenibacillus plantiphilus TaxID=2905650 RepID=A0ABN8GVR9_9BACL|nr:RDD family protein [Paenibacillus plantiphilus]CAH1217257.1 hypothetical protein PAECIP111893_04243 [Paenibacillus plantiphilus]